MNRRSRSAHAENARTRSKMPVIAIVLVAAVVVVAAAIALYCDHNLHAEERTIAAAESCLTTHQATIDGATISYAEGPDAGEPLLLIHGQGMTWQDYASVLPELTEHYHVFAVDCFGHGESQHDPSLYSCTAGGDALIAFAHEVIEEPYLVSGHSSGGILAAYVAANDEAVIACVLEDPPFFCVTPDEVSEGAGAFVWLDGYQVTHDFLAQDEVTDYPTYYARHSYLFGLFGGLQDMLAEQTEQLRATQPDAPVTNAWIPRTWTRGMYFMGSYDPRFGDAFYDGSWMAGIDQEGLLASIDCPTVYLKAKTAWGEDGVLYAANTDEDAARVARCIEQCETIELDCGHDIHVELPDEFIAAVDRAQALAAEA